MNMSKNSQFLTVGVEVDDSMEAKKNGAVCAYWIRK